MKMDIVAGSKNDEFYTPEYAIEPIVKYIPKGSKVWCPFDTQESNFVKILSKTCEVTYSHIHDFGDFFKMLPPEGCQYIVSNPPYSLKTEVFERLFALKIPFAMLVGVVGLFESKRRFSLFRNNEFEVMYLSGRVSYFKSYAEQKPSLNPPFSSVYLCQGILPERIVFEEIIK